MKHAAITKECTSVEEDITAIIGEFKQTIETHLSAVKKQRAAYPEGSPHVISEKLLNELFEICHHLREQGEQVDYITYSKALDQADILLKKLRAPIQFRRSDILGDISELLTNLQNKTSI